MKLRVAFPGALAVLAVLSFGSPAWAADPLESITASPTVERINLDAGAEYDGSYKITNTGKTPYGFGLSSSPYSVSGEGYDATLTARPDLIDASKWFSFPPLQYTAEAGEVVPVQYHISVPKDVAPGGYYAALFAEVKAKSSEQGITGRKRVGILFYLTVAGQTKHAGTVNSFTVPYFQSSPPLHSELRLTNSGNVHFDAEVSVQVADLFGNVKAQLDSNQVVFPGTTRKVEINWEKAPSFGLFRVSGTAKFLDKSNQLPAHYVLMLSANAFLIIVVIVIVLVGLAIFSRRRGGNVYRR